MLLFPDKGAIVYAKVGAGSRNPVQPVVDVARGNGMDAIAIQSCHADRFLEGGEGYLEPETLAALHKPFEHVTQPVAGKRIQCLAYGGARCCSEMAVLPGARLVHERRNAGVPVDGIAPLLPIDPAVFTAHFSVRPVDHDLTGLDPDRNFA